MAFIFEQQYDLHSDRIYQYIYFLVGHAELAEDLTQETFIKAIQSQHTFRNDASTLTWLMKIARNLTYDYYRRKRIISFLPFTAKYDTKEESFTPEKWLEQNEESKRLYEALQKVKMDYREAIVLRKIEGLTIKETAKILGWNESKVKNCTERGMKALRQLLGGGDEDE
ncbi:RNA polymerase sigma factor [Lysinibacillus antri]|uniref:RNA polymerase sigma factor n=1 Tax=Lysinibacillus antri TaxID=2498145 RepID=A0A3S0PAA1_9BACI|nr:RNA polymerase sigma factor [Lysinibacillus antri]RUL56855.1 RNA polymerase sigma factor [Lysinibacillus antri]